MPGSSTRACLKGLNCTIPLAFPSLNPYSFPPPSFPTFPLPTLPPYSTFLLPTPPIHHISLSSLWGEGPPRNPARGSGERCKLPSGSGQNPTAKQQLSCDSSFEDATACYWCIKMQFNDVILLHILKISNYSGGWRYFSVGGVTVRASFANPRSSTILHGSVK